MQYAAKLDPVGTDVLVIGDGAGLAASSAAGEAGARAILVERDEGMNALGFIPSFSAVPRRQQGEKAPARPAAASFGQKLNSPDRTLIPQGLPGYNAAGTRRACSL